MEQVNKKRIRIIVLSVFFLFILSYGIYTSYGVLFGIKIKNISLVDGATITENTTKITGNAKHAVYLSLNGREISIDKDGNFTETIALLSGYNIVELVARDKFGNVDIKNYKLIH